jgi:hypothetical protein
VVLDAVERLRQLRAHALVVVAHQVHDRDQDADGPDIDGDRRGDDAGDAGDLAEEVDNVGGDAPFQPLLLGIVVGGQHAG